MSATSATTSIELSSNPVDVTDHHHHHGLSSSTIPSPFAVDNNNAVVPNINNKNTIENVTTAANRNEMTNNNLPSLHIENNNVVATPRSPRIRTTTPAAAEIVVDNNDNNQQQQQQQQKQKQQQNQQKSNWVMFDDDDDDDNRTHINTPDTKVVVVANSNKTITTPIPTAIPITISPLHLPTTTTTVATTATATPTPMQQIKTEIPVLPGPPLQQNNKAIPKPSLPSSSSVSADITPAAPAAVLSHINLNSVTTSPQSTTTTATSVRKDIASKNTTSSSLSIPPSSLSTSSGGNAGGAGGAGAAAAATAAASGAQMRTIELSTGRIREGFANGDVIVTLLPTNSRWPWVTPAIFRPELVPEELMAQGLTLTVEEYVNAMETLVNDYRFTVYNICYKRVLVCWILFAFCVLITLLLSGLKGIALFSLGVGWLFLNAAAIILCMWIKLRVSRGLEKCLARVNKQLIRHKIIIVLDDRGRISCHKVNLCFLYFDPAQCIAYLNEFMERSEQNGTTIQTGWESRLDVDVTDIVIQGSNPVRLSRKQERGLLLYLRYGSRWGNEVIRGLGDVSAVEPARHCSYFLCPCQYIERHLSCKPRGYPCSCCIYLADPNYQYQY